MNVRSENGNVRQLFIETKPSEGEEIKILSNLEKGTIETRVSTDTLSKWENILNSRNK